MSLQRKSDFIKYLAKMVALPEFTFAGKPGGASACPGMFVGTNRVGKKLYQPSWSKGETMVGHLCREHAGITYLGMWVRPESFGPSCANLLCPGQPFLKSGETHRVVDIKCTLLEGKELRDGQEFVH